jgi:WD40 repeat protein
MRIALSALLVFALVRQLASAAANPDEAISFSRDVAPILNRQCANCHGPKKAKGGFRLHTFENLMQCGSSKKPPITPGSAEKSKLYQLLVTTDEDDLMPKDADPLPKAQIEIIRRWIEQGAKFDGADRNTVLSTLASSVTHEAAPKNYSSPEPVTALAYSPDGAEIAVSGHDEVTVWSAADGKLLRRIGGLPSQTFALAYARTKNLLAIAGGVSGELGEVRLVDPATGRLVRLLATLEETAFGVAFSPDDSQIAVAAADQSVRIFDTSSGRQTFRMDDHSDWVMSVAFSPDGKHLVTASRDKTAKVIDLPSGEVRRTFRDHDKQVYDAAFSADSQRVYSIGADRMLRIWDIDDPEKSGKKSSSTAVRFDADPLRMKVTEKGVLICCADNSVRLISADGRKALRSMRGGSDWFYALSYDEKSGRVAAGSYNGEVQIWNTGDGSPVFSFTASPGFTSAPNAIANEPAK